MKKVVLLTAALTSALFFSCQKESLLLSEEEQAIIMDDVVSDNVMEAASYEVDFYSSSSDIINSINNAGEKSTWPRWRYKNGVGPAVSVNPIGWSFPKTITIDYGEGIELVNGSIIKGVITINVSARPLSDGATREVLYENFYVDSVHIEGSALRTFVGSVSTQRIFTSVSDLTLTFADGTVLNRSSERQRTLQEGFGTPFYHEDDVILIEGFVDYETSNGKTFSKAITQPLVKTGACRFITQGTVAFSKNGEEFAQLDYGDGSCDDVATITKDGQTRQITIGKRVNRFWAR